jgi:hypothetical protein
VVDDVRCRAWPMFLDVSNEPIFPTWDDDSNKYRDYRQLVVDVDRSLNAYDCTEALEPDDK